MISEVFLSVHMAKAMTGTFTITTRVEANAVGYTTQAIPIGSLIDVGDAQALEIESVDYIYQARSSTTNTFEVIHPLMPFPGDTSCGVQVMDRDAGTFISAADNNLISSSGLLYDYANIVTAASDFYPDDFQKTNGRFVVNDEIYCVLFNAAATSANTHISCAVRIRAKVVKLSTRDWMAISLETVQNE